MDGDLSLLIAFTAGSLSFLSPCVLPLVPGYLCFIAGVKLEDIAPFNAVDTSQTSKNVFHRSRVMAASGLFVLGFSTVFIALGAGASSISFLLLQNQNILSKIAGGVIILLGLHVIGVFRLSVLNLDTRYQQKQRPVSILGAYAVGLAFSFGWTPCIGPILATVLSMAAQQQNMAEGVLLLTVYAAGLGIPFLIAAFATEKFMGFMRSFRKHMRMVERATGILLIGTGIMMLTGGLEWLGFWLLDLFPALAKIG